MKKGISILIIILFSVAAMAQHVAADSAAPKVIVNKDPRLDILAKAEAEINSYSNRFAKGYRLFVLKTNNRDYAMKVRAYLLQTFPEEKVVMTYQSPFIKMKFGDFTEKKDAEKYRDLIIRSGVVTGGVYLLPEMVELKPDKIKDQN
ncbi:MAG: hypothetical protein IPP96_04955 [Chitinophagaceae bacterium]|nr:hypothetical protein [Chitinophagaceae bacterium]